MPLQRPPGPALPRTHRETYAEALADAEREFRAAQAGLAVDGSDAARERYRLALYNYDRLQAMFPFVAAGAGDVHA